MLADEDFAEFEVNTRMLIFLAPDVDRPIHGLLASSVLCQRSPDSAAAPSRQSYEATGVGFVATAGGTHTHTLSLSLSPPRGRYEGRHLLGPATFHLPWPVVHPLSFPSQRDYTALIDAKAIELQRLGDRTFDITF